VYYFPGARILRPGGLARPPLETLFIGPSPGGRALQARKGQHWVSAKRVVTGHSVFRLSLALDETFWYAHGLAPRARRPRPSEKIGLRVSPGPPPRGDPSSDHQSRGGAGSARPRGAYGLDRGMCPVGQGPLASSSGENGMPRHSSGLTTRTRRPRPSEKITPRIVSRSSPQGHPSLRSPPRGGAGSARPRGRPNLLPVYSHSTTGLSPSHRR